MCCFVTILYVAMFFCFEKCFLQEYSIRNGHRGRFRRLDLIVFSTINFRSFGAYNLNSVGGVILPTVSMHCHWYI